MEQEQIEDDGSKDENGGPNPGHPDVSKAETLVLEVQATAHA
jgi:hypothetical protein